MSRQHQAGRRGDSAPGPERPRWPFLVTGGLVYAGVLLEMWIVLASQPDAQDLAVGPVAPVLAVGVGYLISQARKMVPSVRAADLRTLAVVPWQVVVETGAGLRAGRPQGVRPPGRAAHEPAWRWYTSWSAPRSPMRARRCRDELIPRGGASAPGGADSLRMGVLAF